MCLVGETIESYNSLLEYDSNYWSSASLRQQKNFATYFNQAKKIDEDMLKQKINEQLTYHCHNLFELKGEEVVEVDEIDDDEMETEIETENEDETFTKNRKKYNTRSGKN